MLFRLLLKPPENAEVISLKRKSPMAATFKGCLMHTLSTAHGVDVCAAQLSQF